MAGKQFPFSAHAVTKAVIGEFTAQASSGTYSEYLHDTSLGDVTGFRVKPESIESMWYAVRMSNSGLPSSSYLFKKLGAFKDEYHGCCEKRGPKG